MNLDQNEFAVVQWILLYYFKIWYSGFDIFNATVSKILGVIIE
jgi:hypothetical protein